MKKTLTDAQRAKRQKINVIYVYVIITIAVVFFALLISTQSFFNPLNFTSDEICYLERSEYLNPMLISGSKGNNLDKVYVFQDKPNLYAMFVYMQQAELVETEDVFDSQEAFEKALTAETTTVLTVYSKTVDTEPVFICYYLGEGSEYVIVRAMPEYPSGELRLMALPLSEKLSEVMSILNNECRYGLEADE